MKTLKIKTAEGWVSLYQTFLESCLRKEYNLSDISDPEKALENLGLWSANVESHAHDSHYIPMLNELEEKLRAEFMALEVKEFVKSIIEKNGTFTITDGKGQVLEVSLPKTVNGTAPDPETGDISINVDGKVLTVNGKGPDEKGNIFLESPIPVGTVLPYASAEAPKGFFICNGAEKSRTTYAKLFSVIGTMYGSGDGSTTFNLPNLTDDRFMQFSGNAGFKKDPGLPNITGFTASFPHKCDNMWAKDDQGNFGPSGAFYASGESRTGRSDGRQGPSAAFDASRSNPIYGGSDTVQPKALTLNAIIKY